MTIKALFVILSLSQCLGAPFDISHLSNVISASPPVKSQHRQLQDTTVITDLTSIIGLDLLIDPPDGHFSPTALGVFLRASSPGALIYYTLDGTAPHLSSNTITSSAPYLHVDTPFLAGRYRRLRAVAAEIRIDGEWHRSVEYDRTYIVEATDRPNSFLFLVPGLETKGYFIRVGIEMAAEARAQLAGQQEFANFNSTLGLGTYNDQLRVLHLPTIDNDLTGFEGGFSGNTSSGQFGYLIPYHNGHKFFGKLVRVNLFAMENTTTCYSNYRIETLVEGEIVVEGVSRKDACVVVLDLESLHPNAAGFKRGFLRHPYGYLSPGQFDVAIRINVEDFGLHSTKALPLREIRADLGGYSGGWADDTWACFNPMRSFVGPIGGVRSNLTVDRNHLRTYHHALVMCVNESAWQATGDYSSLMGTEVRTIDLGDVEPSLRGFSDALRVGRYVYLCPFASNAHTYSSRLVRIDIGNLNLIDKLDSTVKSGGKLRDLVDILDLTQKDTGLAGFSGLFNAGKYLYLVPWRSSHEAYNGQRGHGLIPRIDLNIFDSEGIDVMDLPETIRAQIPSFPDTDLRGFTGGVASGKYGLLFPFYNGIFSGKLARLDILLWNNLQELNLLQDVGYPDTFKGFRGGFVNLWMGTAEDV